MCNFDFNQKEKQNYVIFKIVLRDKELEICLHFKISVKQLFRETHTILIETDYLRN